MRLAEVGARKLSLARIDFGDWRVGAAISMC